LLLAGAGVLALAGAGAATTESLHGPIEAEVLRIVDGDTVEVRARIWLGQTITTLVSIDGIDTPERRSRCAAEKTAADRATALVASMLPTGAVIRLHGVKTGKYAGRVVAGVETADGRDVAKALLDSALARPYDGRSRAGWCD
jgi:endonuclease YncB( thermonuclease family)